MIELTLESLAREVAKLQREVERLKSFDVPIITSTGGLTVNDLNVGTATGAGTGVVKASGASIGAGTTTPLVDLNAGYAAASSIQSIDFHINGNSIASGRIGNPTNGTTGELALYTTPNFSTTAPSERLRLDGNGNVKVVGGTLATNATDGFLTIRTCAGAPTGVPTGGNGSMVYDTTNNKLWVYNGAWKGVVLA